MSVRVLEVADLGYEAALVDIDDETVLLVCEGLDIDERIELLTLAMAQIDRDAEG